MLEKRQLPLKGLFELIPDRIQDERGFFSEVWNAAVLQEAGINLDFVQDNHSLSRDRGVLRGLHYQIAPFAQTKLVRVARGSVFDVAVDIRRDSPTFGQWTGLTLSAVAWNQLLVPDGFAHGFLTLEARTEVLYKVTKPYSRTHERIIRFDDPAIGIEWPVLSDALILSDKDRAAPSLAASGLLP